MSKYTLDALACYALDVENIQARNAVMEIIKQGPQPGKIIALNKQQWKALQKGLIIVQLPQSIYDAAAKLVAEREAEVAAALLSSPSADTPPSEPLPLPSPDQAP